MPLFPLYFHAASISSASVVILSQVHTQFISTRDSPSPDTILACALGTLMGQDLMAGTGASHETEGDAPSRKPE